MPLREEIRSTRGTTGGAYQVFRHLTTPSSPANMSPAHSFNGQVALVTGGGSGIGRATCQLLARDGARVVVTDVNLKAARETQSLMPDSANHLAMEMDVTKNDDVEVVIASARKKFGASPSLLVNSAGLGKMEQFLEVKEETLNTLIDVNLKGIFLVTQAFTKALLENNEETKEGTGAVVNIASMAGKTGMRGMTHYSCTKGGVMSLTKSCAAELASKGLRVNCVLPALIDTPMHLGIPKESVELYKNKNPLRRLGRPEEVAEVVIFLLSRRSSYMVGACVEVSGGTDM